MDKLKATGWCLLEEIEYDEDGGNRLSETDLRNLALNSDLKDIGSAVLDEKFDKASGLQGPLVLQISKIRDVQLPKAVEFARSSGGGGSRLLRITLTDGHTSCSALETENLKNISLQTPPGQKVLVEGAEAEHGFLLLNNRNCQSLGGLVHKLAEKWKINQNSMSSRVGSGDGGPPRWVPFGQRIPKQQHDKNFKSLGAAGEGKEAEATSTEFELARKAQIREAAGQHTHKSFQSAKPKIPPPTATPRPKSPAQSSAPTPKPIPTPTKPPTAYDKDFDDLVFGRGPERRGRGRRGGAAGEEELRAPVAPSTLFDFFQINSASSKNGEVASRDVEPPRGPPPPFRQDADSFRGRGNNQNWRSNQFRGRGRGGSDRGRGSRGRPPPPRHEPAPQRVDLRPTAEGWPTLDGGGSVWRPGSRCIAPARDGRMYEASIVEVEGGCVTVFFPDLEQAARVRVSQLIPI